VTAARTIVAVALVPPAIGTFIVMGTRR